MALKIIYKPIFKAKDIYHKAFNLDWGEFQLHAFNMGKILHKHMQSYITTNHKRSGATGKLAKGINFNVLSTTGKISWGIGHIPTLNQQAHYWYAINYGKKVNGQPFIPGGGKYRPVEFEDGPANSSRRGQGTSKAIKFRKLTGGELKPSVIRPMHFIQDTYSLLIKHTRLLLLRYKK